ncbi:MAG: Fe(2+)-trafficking protein [Phycisphaerales bacterium]|jgi:Fe-S cluster biosynthesis and repair protein YggX|nr:Fe(2+)-trafficking protein [Phycisphaerales bacterium]
MDVKNRIAQFENMAQADPTNEMAHFSLGRAYADAGRWSDAADSFMRCIQLVPDMSKAYQLAGEAMIKAGQNQRASQVLLDGYEVAGQKGDLMPKRAIAELLKSIGQEPPASATVEDAGGPADTGGPIPEGMMRCSRTGKLGTRMQRPPFRGPIGEWIQANISSETFFKMWIPQGTKVINELRLDLSREKDQETYDQHMREYLGIDADVLAQINAGGQAGKA